MKFDLIVASEEDGYRWVSHDLEKDFDLVLEPEQLRLVAAIRKMMGEARQRAQENPPPPHVPCWEYDFKEKHVHEDGHDCFAPENEYFEMHGNATYTSCAVCGFAISAG